jgi:hypothetical protein
VSTSVAGALGQLAWLLYKGQYRPLLDFEMHQKAGHGAIGSLMLLFHLKFSWRRLAFTPPCPPTHIDPRYRPLQWLFAVLSVCGFLTSPLTQLAITYISPSVPINNGTATAFRTTTFSRLVGTTYTAGKMSLLLIHLPPPMSYNV